MLTATDTSVESTNTTIIETATVNVAQAARLCGISEGHFYGLTRTGRFGPTPIRLGRSVRYLRQEILDWLKAGAPPRQRWDARHR
jgi:predicted DNA-binding transcriptional regulator AlpA